MKNSFQQLFFTLIIGGLIASTFAFKAPANSYEYMVFTTVESIIPGGVGRSRMITSNEMGMMNEEKMNNLYSMVGINFKNIYDNDVSITAKLNSLSNEGWELFSTSTGVQSPNNEGKNGIFCTRYTLRRYK